MHHPTNTENDNNTVSRNITCSLKCGTHPSNRTRGNKSNDGISAALGIDKSTDILSHIRSIPTLPERAAAAAKIEAIEREAMLSQQPQPGLVELMDYLQKRGLRRALCTRNFEYAAPDTN